MKTKRSLSFDVLESRIALSNGVVVVPPASAVVSNTDTNYNSADGYPQDGAGLDQLPEPVEGIDAFLDSPQF
jgi:hypothetical protein